MPRNSRWLQHVGGHVVDLVRVFVAQVIGHIGFRQMARPGARGMQEGAAGAPRAVDDLFVENLDVCTVVGLAVGNQLDQSGPAAADADNPIAFAQSADR